MITSYFEKESFWLPKGVVLLTKRSPFTMQKDSFYNAKGALLFLANNRRGVANNRRGVSKVKKGKKKAICRRV